MLKLRDLAPLHLHPVDLDVADGETVSVQGPSGSGKSLLLRAIADLDPVAGEAWLDGVARSAVPGPQWRQRVCYLATDAGWWAATVGAHFADWSRIAAHLEELGLPADCRDWPVARLSSGERQRLALLRALAGAPRVLLLDEPTSALDEASTQAVERLVAAHCADGLAAIWVSHDPAQAKRVARRHFRLSDGRLVTP